MPFKCNAAHRDKIPKQKYRITNWTQYEAGLRQRGSITFSISDETYKAVRRHSHSVSIIVPPRLYKLQDTCHGLPDQRDWHTNAIAEHGRMGLADHHKPWQISQSWDINGYRLGDYHSGGLRCFKIRNANTLEMVCWHSQTLNKPIQTYLCSGKQEV